MKKIYFMISAIIFSNNIICKLRSLGAPFISGDSFRTICDFVYDDESTLISVNILHELIKEGNTVFVQNEFLEKFFNKIHKKIKYPYFLVTHNSDLDSPGKFRSYLDDPKIIKWFSLNADTIHPKLIPIPIGIISDCNYFKWQGIPVLEKNIAKKHEYHKDMILLLNFTIGTYIQERKLVYDIFSKLNYCTILYTNNPEDYLVSLAKSKFILSPRGTGQDCHRTWEAILMGCIPIVKSSTLNALYENLPILIINNWNEINSEFLELKYKEITSKKYNYDKLNFTYWSRLITNYQRQYFEGKN